MMGPRRSHQQLPFFIKKCIVWISGRCFARGRAARHGPVVQPAIQRPDIFLPQAAQTGQGSSHEREPGEA